MRFVVGFPVELRAVFEDWVGGYTQGWNQDWASGWVYDRAQEWARGSV